MTWGTVVCMHCNEIIEWFDSEKVTTYYGVCNSPSCAEGKSSVRKGKVNEMREKK